MQSCTFVTYSGIWQTAIATGRNVENTEDVFRIEECERAGLERNSRDIKEGKGVCWNCTNTFDNQFSSGFGTKPHIHIYIYIYI